MSLRAQVSLVPISFLCSLSSAIENWVTVGFVLYPPKYFLGTAENNILYNIVFKSEHHGIIFLIFHLYFKKVKKCNMCCKQSIFVERFYLSSFDFCLSISASYRILVFGMYFHVYSLSKNFSTKVAQCFFSIE